MVLLFLLLLILVLSVLSAYLEDKYYVDKHTGEILFHYDNDYDYNWRKWNR